MGRTVVDALNALPGGKALKKINPIDKSVEGLLLKGERSKQAKASAASQSAADQAAANKAAADKAAADQAAEQKSLADAKKKQQTANEESRRSAISNFLAAEGSQTGRRRFLVGAK